MNKTIGKRMNTGIVSAALALAVALSLFCGRQSAQGAGEARGKAELQQLYMTYLKDEGFRPEVDPDGDVLFKREGKTYFIQVTENDPQFFRLVLPNIWRIESEAERARVRVAADLSNARCKGAKVHTVRDNVWIGLELFLPSQDDFKSVFRRSLSAIDFGLVSFGAAMVGDLGVERNGVGGAPARSRVHGI